MSVCKRRDRVLRAAGSFVMGAVLVGCGGSGAASTATDATEGTAADDTTASTSASTTTASSTTAGDTTLATATTGTPTTGDDATTGDATTGDATTGDATTGDATTGDDATGVMTDGTTGEPVAPTLELMAITDPTWEIVDFHQRTAEVGANYEDLFMRRTEVLPPPEHVKYPGLGIGPGAAHDGPYDHEFADNWAELGLEDAFEFPLAEATLPNAVLANWMVVPGPKAPKGKTPDAVSGPMIPNTLFPIHYTLTTLVDGEPVVNGGYEFDVPALDMKLNPPFDVDGHSHVPMFDDRTTNREPVGAIYSTHATMIDTTGAGWSIKFGFKVLP